MPKHNILNVDSELDAAQTVIIHQAISTLVSKNRLLLVVYCISVIAALFACYLLSPVLGVAACAASHSISFLIGFFLIRKVVAITSEIR